MKIGTDGYPTDKAYLEENLPPFLQKDIDALIVGENTTPAPLYLDCLYDEVYGSINAAYYDGLISESQANYLRNKYL